MSQSKSKKGTKKITVTSSHPTPFESQSAQQCFQHFGPLAQAIPTDSLEPFRIHVDIAVVNARTAVSAIRPHIDTLRRKAPECPVHEILEVQSIALGLLYASQKVMPAASDREIEARLEAIRPMREATLRQLEVFASLGKLDKKVPAAIRRGKGSLDTAQDAVAIAGVFDEHQSFGGKHPFSAEEIDKLRADGDWLVNVLKPQGAKGARVTRDPAAILRDQFGALLVARYDELRHAAVVVFGLKSFDEHVPALGARAAGSRSDTETTEGTPAPADK